MTWRLISSLLPHRVDWREDISAYMDGELSPRDRARVESRLAESVEMQEYLADLQRMRSVLRSFEAAPGEVPFQLTTEMLNDTTQISVQPASTTRALRLSMSTAAVGVATFAAVMVFDAVDSPTVNFTTTSADAQATLVPTASVVTQAVEVQTQAREAADEAASPASGESETVAALADEAQQDDEQVAVAAVASVEDEEEAAEEAIEQEQAEQQAEAYQEEQAQQEVEEAVVDESAADPSRRALTAGRSSGTGESKSVNVEDVVAQEEEAEEAVAAAASREDDAQEQAADATVAQDSGSRSSAVEAQAGRSSDDDRALAEDTETRSVATSVARGESDWPLEQRPRSSTVQLARDPSWELPVQIVLAAIAISSAVFWLVLTIVDRRRRA
ncbi:MAG: zf-HC2 domain-containing protein [Chloroflexota bacterium]|nr:zf-HC2 domain-containing protein [Chloroflexota bacterium]